jgi:DNA polymerase-1
MVHRVLDAITGITEIEKIRNTFIKAFKENTIRKQDGNTYLHGNFNLGGTVSGRLSSSNPNLTNIPSGSTYGKLIKSCFKSNDKWLFCGADYNALEARADALWTKDKNKLAIYEGGYDSHSYNTYAYWPSKFPDITAAIADIPEDDHKARAEHINKIDGLYSKERSASKPVTFALQFKGTSYTLHKRAGFPMDEAETIVANYANLYKESKEATDIRIAKAVEEGYVTVAFGLRVRTPLLKMAVIDDPKNMPPIIAAEIRTAANAMSQSYGQLTNLVMVKTIRDSEEAGYATDILPCCIIHDAAYFICRRNVTALKFLNDCLGKHMAWVPPELYHPTVGLSGEMECFYPAWSTPIKIPNEASKEEIREIFNNV